MLGCVDLPPRHFHEDEQPFLGKGDRPLLCLLASHPVKNRMNVFMAVAHLPRGELLAFLIDKNVRSLSCDLQQHKNL